MEDKKVLLSIKDLQVKFRVRGRILTAIRGVTLDIYCYRCACGAYRAVRFKAEV